jgi:serine-type D-Ala-D-Ala carboxypeptidase (penicillin-binding protein 5/6)
MGEPTEAARDADTLALLRWGLDRFRRVRVVPRGRTLARVDVRYRDEPAPLVARRGVVVTVRAGQHLDRRVHAPDELEGPVAKGERVGSVTVLVGGRRVRRVALVTGEEVPGAGTLKVLLSEVGVPLTVLVLLAILVGALLALRRVRIRIRIAK